MSFVPPLFSVGGVAMADPMNLSVLSKTNAKLATFAVAMHGGRVFDYSYKQQKMATASPHIVLKSTSWA